MNCLSWNCRGLGNPRAIRVLSDLVKVRKPDFLFLSETFSNASRIEVLRIKFGFFQCFSVDSVGHSGGLAVFWKHQVNCEISGFSRNHVDVVFNENNVASWRLSCFYGFPERHRRSNSWHFIRTLAGVSNLPWCIFGDFNDLLHQSDKTGGKYTWEKGRGTDRWVRERLDRAFVSSSWLRKFPLCKLIVHHVTYSDHDPINLDLLSVNCSRKQFRFKFENTWLEEPAFRKDVVDHWLDLPSIHILPKLISVSSFMARWGRNFFHKFREKIKKLKDSLSKLVDRTDTTGLSLYFAEREKLDELLRLEEVYWKQRAKTFWLAEGDENTKFFHANASARRKTNRIGFLERETGEHVDNHEDMCHMVRDYFSEVFKGDQRNSEVQQNVASTAHISEEQNRSLVDDISFDEFSLAIKQMHPDKASGPDGLNPTFFQQFWSMLGKEVFLCCKEWLQVGSFPAHLNDTNVVLIPKKENACNMKDLRPIALCNVLYKILAKSAFVPGRNITDNVLVAFEIIHNMNRKSKGTEGEIALKLDISKAYDRVDWDFLKSRMLQMGFCGKWVSWIMMCVTTVSYEFCFNGSYVGPIIPSRGLRQGDPLSPYLFLLCVEGLSDVLINAAAVGDIHGSQICHLAPIVTHLLFADDSFLFFRAKNEEASRIVALLKEYEYKSGQSVNLQKSGIFFSANVGHQKREELSAILGVHNDLRDSKYLGLPSLVGRSKKRVFSFVKEKVWKKIQGWKSKPISRAGKAILIRNVAQSIPSYCMSCFLLPKSLCQEIERMLNKFWWNSGSTDRKGIHWLSWDAMSMSKPKGGLGFRSLYGFNVAMLGKLCWNFLHNPLSLVARLYKACYYPNDHLLKATAKPGASFIWTGILTAKNNLAEGFRWVLGDGVDINAYKDPWLRGNPDFKVNQNHRYESYSTSVSSLFFAGAKVWDVVKVRDIFSEVDANSILKTKIPQNDVRDRIAWTKATNGHYSVKTGYHLWHERNVGTSNVTQSSGWGQIWKLSIPHKVKVLLWRVCRNNLPVRSRLSSKGVQLSLACPMCDSCDENVLHLFFDCYFARQCWLHVGGNYYTQEVEHAPDWILNKICEGSRDEVVRIARVLWGIWFVRNKKVWENKAVTPGTAMDMSAKLFLDWKHAVSIRKVTQTNVNSSVVVPQMSWSPPEIGCFKLNTDASFRSDSASFSIGLVLRDHLGSFVAGKAASFTNCHTVLEAETIAIWEGFKWLTSMSYQYVSVESDSFLSIQAIRRPCENLLELGHILESCRTIMQSRAGFSISFIKRQANKVAHEMAKIPCLLNCQNLVTTPPSSVQEMLLKKGSREGSAITLIVDFVNVVENTRTLQPNDPKIPLDDIVEILHKLEYNGFDVNVVCEHVVQLLSIKDKREEHKAKENVKFSDKVKRPLILEGNNGSNGEPEYGACDSSVNEQMPFVLRYVDMFGEVLEYFIRVTHVSDTSTISLKLAVENVLTKYGLSISKVRGQGYDGALNMREELNGMKTLILKENPSAGYVHCFSHQLQLVVVSVEKEVQFMGQFFDYVSMIVNMVGASCKRNDALRQKQDHIVQNLEKSEKTIGTRMYQEISLARPVETRWGSYYKTIIRILAMWSAVLEVLGDVDNDGVC
ncbi:uncharacterized protein LOC141695803 [Apium graveolens]|uniref:uncharacterized protein LOC141695803 n=1 Tax=Apium graveolens TaxID=4045 RepID=UPI003D7A1F1D